MNLFFQLGILATTRMIRNHSLASGMDYVELNWTHPKFLPERYQLKYMCTMKPTCAPNHNINQSVMTNVQSLSSNTTSVRVIDLRRSSICMLFLLAVYNPASIDSGIWVFGTTLSEDASKRNLYYVIK